MLEIYQGNDKNFVFSRKNTDGEIITTVPQELYFTVRADFQGNIIFQKQLNNGISQKADGTWNIRVDAENTKNLDVPSIGLKCVCDVKVFDENGEETTIVKPQPFLILPVATRI